MKQETKRLIFLWELWLSGVKSGVINGSNAID